MILSRRQMLGCITVGFAGTLLPGVASAQSQSVETLFPNTFYTLDLNPGTFLRSPEDRTKIGQVPDNNFDSVIGRLAAVNGQQVILPIHFFSDEAWGYHTITEPGQIADFEPRDNYEVWFPLVYRHEGNLVQAVVNLTGLIPGVDRSNPSYPYRDPVKKILSQNYFSELSKSSPLNDDIAPWFSLRFESSFEGSHMTVFSPDKKSEGIFGRNYLFDSLGSQNETGGLSWYFVDLLKPEFSEFGLNKEKILFYRNISFDGSHLPHVSRNLYVRIPNDMGEPSWKWNLISLEAQLSLDSFSTEISFSAPFLSNPAQYQLTKTTRESAANDYMKEHWRFSDFPESESILTAEIDNMGILEQLVYRNNNLSDLQKVQLAAMFKHMRVYVERSGTRNGVPIYTTHIITNPD